MKPYISTYLNNNDDVVLLYIPEVKPYEQVTPECIVIHQDHIKELIKELNKARKEILEG